MQDFVHQQYFHQLCEFAEELGLTRVNEFDVMSEIVRILDGAVRSGNFRKPRDLANSDIISVMIVIMSQDMSQNWYVLGMFWICLNGIMVQSLYINSTKACGDQPAPCGQTDTTFHPFKNAPWLRFRGKWSDDVRF